MKTGNYFFLFQNENQKLLFYKYNIGGVYMNKKEKMIKKINNSVFQMINDGYTYREISKKTGYSISKISRLRKQQLLLTIGE